MKKILTLLLVLAVSGCASASQTHAYDWTIAFADTGQDGTMITWYDDAYQCIGTQMLKGKGLAGPAGSDAMIGYDAQYAYILPQTDTPRNPDDCGIVRMSLQNGTIDILQTESYSNLLLAVNDKAVVIEQRSDDLQYYRTVLPKDGSEASILKDGRFGMLYYALKDGWLVREGLPSLWVYAMNEHFRTYAEAEMGDDGSPVHFPTMDGWRMDGAKLLQYGNKAYIPCMKENRTYTKDADGYYQSSFEGYSYGLMELDINTLSYAVHEMDNRYFTDILPLSDNEILLLCVSVTMQTKDAGSGQHYSYDRSPQKLVIYDTASQEFSDFETVYEPLQCVMSKDTLYIRDTKGIIHVIDIASHKERTSFHHMASITPSSWGIGTMMIVQDPMETLR